MRKGFFEPDPNGQGPAPRKRSYYPFSKNYPSRYPGKTYAIGETRNRRKREKLNRILLVFLLLLLFSLSFLAASVAIRLSERSPEKKDEGAVESRGRLVAVYMPDGVLDGGVELELFRTGLGGSGANAVLVDFKTAQGCLNFPLQSGTAAELGAVQGAYENAASTLSALKKKGYRIVARVCCFKDALAASRLGAAAAVTQADGSLWLDDSAQRDGSPWLNPYSAAAESYLLGIISETAASGADLILLDAVQFPDGPCAQSAVFAGAQTSVQSRNAVLHAFIERAADCAGEVPVCVMMTANGALNGDALRYDGSIFDSAAELCAVDFRACAQEDGSASGEDLLGVSLPLLQAKLRDNYHTAGLLPVIDSRACIPLLEKQGIRNYILFGEACE